ncbi:hypothetical protein MHU86_479 [Fragilaria crotonensis]|nr:hypothetical protein MHU86_479 [Fragilaria crotonensis]
MPYRNNSFALPAPSSFRINSICVNSVPLDLTRALTLIVVTNNLLDSFPLTPLKRLFVRRRKMKAFTAMKNRMAPNGGRMQFSYDAVVAADSPTLDVPVPRPDEPNVYNFPTSLVPTYRALPVLAKVAVAALSAWMAAASTFREKSLWLRPLVAIAENHLDKRQLVVFLLKASVYFL